MHFESFVAWTALAGAAMADTATSRTCMNITVPVTISARNAVFGNLQTPQTNIDAAGFILANSRNGVNGTEVAFTGFRNIHGTYNISAMYCMPAKSMQVSKPKLQILTHGIGFDKTYWDLSYNDYNYSYIDTALAKGYHTLSYDRLGIGLSSHGDPKNEIQVNLEVASLAEITKMLRAGKFPGVHSSFNKIIHVGHSFGSAQSYILTALYPTISDGIVLTGFSLNNSFKPQFFAGGDFVQARTNQPLRFGSAKSIDDAVAFNVAYGLTDLFTPVDFTTLPKPLDYPLGYLVNSNPSSLVYLFLLPGHFDPGILYFGEAGKQPVTVGELLTQGGAPAVNKFTGPVLVVTGSNDIPFCGGDCRKTGDPKVPSIPSQVSEAFPKTKVSTYIVPQTGHGINFHYTAKAAYNYIQSYLGKNGL